MTQTIERTTPESPDTTGSRHRLEPLRVLWHRKWIVLAVTGVAMALGYLYLVQTKPVYRSTAQVLLIRKEAKYAADVAEGQRDPGGYGGYEDQLSTHILKIRSPMIVEAAVKKYHLASLSTLKGTRDPVGRIIAGLRATPAQCDRRAKPDPNVIALEYEGGHPQDCRVILEAVIDSYQESLAETYEDFSGETLDLIGEGIRVLGGRLSDKEKEYREFRRDSPLLWQGNESANFHETRMAEIEKARSELLVEVTRTRARIETIENALKQGGKREALSLLIANSGSSALPDALRMSRSSFEDELFRAVLEEQRLLESYGPDHPMVKAVRKRMSLIQQYSGGASSPDDSEPVDYLAAYVESLHQELKEQEGRRAELNDRFDEERTASKELTEAQIDDDTLRKDIARTERMFEAVVKRLEEINLIKDYGGITTEVISPASHGSLIWPSLPMILGPFLVLGLAVGFGLACVVEIADRRFRSPDDVYRQLGLPLIGHIPVINTRNSRRTRADRKAAAKPPLAPVLCTFHQPRSVETEAYRAVRTSLYFSTDGDGHKVLQVTSPNPGDGKTTLASNLAVSIASSGKRVLLLDADFRHPRIHKYFGLDNDTGVSSVLSEKEDFADAIQETTVENLWAMPCGPKPQNPADVLTTGCLAELLEVLKEKYDFIIVDSPPLLAVTDPSVVAPRVDAVLLVIRLTRSARHDAMRAAEMLSSLGAKMLGIVVNGVGRRHGQYGSNYRYGGYRYGGYPYGGYHYGAYHDGNSRDGRDGSGDADPRAAKESEEPPGRENPRIRPRLGQGR